MDSPYRQAWQDDKLDKFGQTGQPLERKCLEKR